VSTTSRPGLERLTASWQEPGVTEGEGLDLAPGTGSAEHRADPREELAQAEGLGDVVVGAYLEPAHLVRLLAARGEHDDGDVETTLAQGAAHVPAAQPGHHQVEHDEVGRLRGGEGERALTVARGEGLISLEAEIVLEASHHLGLVVHDEDAWHG
jgi:hypothetical protein